LFKVVPQGLASELVKPEVDMFDPFEMVREFF